jgi:uncharacterized protein (DUF1800 family)
MLIPRRRLFLVVAFVASSFASLAVAAHAWKKDKKIAAAAQMDPHTQALHALQRLTFGPRPGDIEHVTAMGLDKWIDQQLRPERIDDSALEARLAPFRTLHMDTKEIVENFPPNPLIRAVMEGKKPMPSDPVKRAIYQAQIGRIQEREERKQERGAENTTGALAAAPASPTTTPSASNSQTAPDSSNDNSTAPASKGNETAVSVDRSSADDTKDDRKAQRREDKLYADLKAEELLDKPPDERMKEVLQMSPEEQRALSASLKGAKGDEFLEGLNPKQKEAMLALDHPEQVVGGELMQAKLLRAIYSERQLEEVMTDFWFNHFNVFIGKGADRYLVTSYEQQVIRQHALGKFEDLLVATAKNPAMLFYLDNWLSVGPDSDIARGIRRYPNRPYRRFPPPPRPDQAKGKKRNGGLNENYGRELMELHTLGVNGGYTQKDVTEVARVLTGWTIDQPQKGGGFKYEERMHEPGTKIVLGHKIKEHGEREGMEVLHILAHHPSTAHFISTKLAMRFVSDDPPPALVDRMAETFLKKNGDIREVLTTMLKSPEFWSESAYRAKVKTPLEFVVSSIRATGADVTDALPLARQLNQLGMPLYGMQPPTGYSMKEEAWVNSSALLGRMNFSMALVSGKIRGVQVETNRLVPQDPSTATPPDSAKALAILESSLLAGTVSRQTHDAIVAELQNQAAGSSNVKTAVKPAVRKNDKPTPMPLASNIGTMAGLILGSPEFQRR